MKTDKKYMNIVIRDVRQDWQLYALLAAPIINYLLFKYGPMIGNIIAFRKYTPGGPFLGSRWIGFRYFKMFISDPNFWNVFFNTIRMSVASLFFGFPASIIFALLLNELRNRLFKKAVQTISYLPHFLSVVVVCGMIMDVLSPSGGIINQIVIAFKGEPIQFMQESKYFVSIYVISGIWQGLGWGAIIYLAALTGIDPQLYEAAEIDGAGRLKQTLHVTIPSMLPTVTILLILNIGNLMNVGFEKIMLLYNPMIYDTADVLSTYLYRMAMQMNNFSFATAVGLFESVIGLILIFSANKIAKAVTGSSLW